MIPRTCHVRPWGFVPTGPFKDAKESDTFYRWDPGTRSMLVLDGCYSDSPRLLLWIMKPAEAEAYAAGRLSVVPPGACAPALGDRAVLGAGPFVMHDGPFRNRGHVEKVLCDATIAVQEAVDGVVKHVLRGPARDLLRNSFFLCGELAHWTGETKELAHGGRGHVARWLSGPQKGEEFATVRGPDNAAKPGA